MGLFGKKTPQERTFLILDVESGSVGGTLVRIAQGERPKLFGETRVLLPVAFSLSGSTLAAQTEQAIKEVVQKLSELAARVRMHNEAASIGRVERGVVFFAPPWGKPNLESGTPEFIEDMQAKVRTAAESRLGRMPLNFFTSAGLAAFGSSSLFEPEPVLLYIVGGEVSELLHHDGAGVRAHATIPLGLHALLRTLRTHGGLSELEARSAARLPFTTAHLREPFSAVAQHVGAHFAPAARELLGDSQVSRVRVMGEGATAEWFARALASYEPLGELFPHGGEVRSLALRHLTPHIAAHQETADLRLMLASLFVDSRLQ